MALPVKILNTEYYPIRNFGSSACQFHNEGFYIFILQKLLYIFYLTPDCRTTATLKRGLQDKREDTCNFMDTGPGVCLHLSTTTMLDELEV